MDPPSASRKAPVLALGATLDEGALPLLRQREGLLVGHLSPGSVLTGGKKAISTGGALEQKYIIILKRFIKGSGMHVEYIWGTQNTFKPFS